MFRLSTFIGLLIYTLITYSCSKSSVTVEEPMFFTSDVELFWEVYDQNGSSTSKATWLNEYVNKGTIGLQDYNSQKGIDFSLHQLLSSAEYVEYYDNIRLQTLSLDEEIETAKAAMKRLKSIYSDAYFFNTYFLIGAMTAGGRISDNGLLVAVEMFSKTDDTQSDSLNPWHQVVTKKIDFLPSIVVHEYIHQLQNFESNHSTPSLLEQSIREGMSDYISKHILSGEPFFNEQLHTYGDPIEEALWTQFKSQKDLSFNSGSWLYKGDETNNGHLPDMGYYVGYKICEAFVENYPSVDEGIVALLTYCDYEKLFKESGYE